MKTLYFRYAVLILCLGVMACKKNDVADLPKSANITVINALTDVPNIKINPSGNSIRWSVVPDLNYGNRAFYYTLSGSGTLSAVSVTDTMKALFSMPVNYKPKIYTLYVSGTASATDYMLNEETDFPFIKTDVTMPLISDHVVNVRFVNLSKGSPGLQIKIKDATAAEVTGLSYRRISDWRPYANVATSTDYIIEVRGNSDAGSPLLSYTFSATATNRFKNVAIIIKGTFGTPEFSISEVNYF